MRPTKRRYSRPRARDKASGVANALGVAGDYARGQRRFPLVHLGPFLGDFARGQRAT